MESTFGSFWAFALLPALVGFGFLLNILARRPSKSVVVGASAFAAVRTTMTVGLLADQYKERRKQLDLLKCVEKNSFEDCMKAAGKVPHVSNQAYGSSGR